MFAHAERLGISNYKTVQGRRSGRLPSPGGTTGNRKQSTLEGRRSDGCRWAKDNDFNIDVNHVMNVECNRPVRWPKFLSVLGLVPKQVPEYFPLTLRSPAIPAAQGGRGN